jgi:L-alanine-DL-glutamate epimerase-like enolase superfamily enzyme
VEGIPINGLVWMGDLTFMKEQINENIAQGFTCIKLKIGALDFENEIDLLKGIRSSFSEEKLILRVDANGAFQRSDIMDKLKKLSDLGIHSIEQPIAANQQELMREICAITPLPIALDEELIGCFDKADRAALLDKIKPQYIILKPTLLGGFKSCEEWIELAEARSIGWWITSALESNLGLNAIAQWTYNLEPHSFQGLGTGDLFTNNIEAPLEVDSGYLKFDPKLNWNLNF